MARQSKPVTRRSKIKPPAHLDAIWVFLIIFGIVLALMALFIWAKLWVFSLVFSALGIFLVWFAIRLHIFSPWAYQVRKAYVSLRQSNWEKHDQDLQALKTLAESFPEMDYRRALILFHIGDMQRMRGRSDEAVQILQQVIQSYAGQMKPNMSERMTAYNNLGVCHYNRGDFSSARECYLKAIQFCEEMKSQQQFLKAICWHNLARIHLDSGEWDEAEDFLAKMDELTRNSKENEANKCFLDLGWAELVMRDGDLRNAEKYARRALAQPILSRVIKDRSRHLH